jgi:hypothetical protein
MMVEYMIDMEMVRWGRDLVRRTREQELGNENPQVDLEILAMQGQQWRLLNSGLVVVS